MDIRSGIPYGKAYTLRFPLWAVDDSDLLDSAPTFASGDVTVVLGDGNEANATNLPALQTGTVFELDLTAAELEAGEIIVTVRDQTSPQTWRTHQILLRTAGHPDASDPQGVVAAGVLTAGDTGGGTLPSGFPDYDITGYVVEAVGGSGKGAVAYIASYNTSTGAFTTETAVAFDDDTEVKVYPSAAGFPASAAEAIRDAYFARTYPESMAELTHAELLSFVACTLLAIVSGVSTNNPVFKNLAGDENAVTAVTSADGRTSVSLNTDAVD